MPPFQRMAFFIFKFAPQKPSQKKCHAKPQRHKAHDGPCAFA
jgi:hypothetical protein